MYVLWLCWYLFISHVLLEKYSPSISYIVLSTDSLVLVVFQDRNIIHHWCELMCTTFIILHTTTWCALRPFLHNAPHNDTGNNSCSGGWQYSNNKSCMLLPVLHELMCTTFTILHTTIATWCTLRVCIIPLLHGNNSCSGSCQYSTDKSCTSTDTVGNQKH